MTNPNVSNPNRPERPAAGRDPHNTPAPRQVETLEPRLLLSASPVEPIENQDDFAEYLAAAGLGGLDQMDISVTLDVPAGFASASGSEQVAAMTGAGMVAVGTQPVGALTGKIVYVHGGHGRYDNGSGWFWQRPLLLEQNEDMSNQDMMSFLVDFLWNAGATVVPLRPVGHQANEVIVDNDDVQVTYVGAWSNSTSSIFYGSPGDTPYRYASTSGTETAYARYRPNIPEAGFYPVYTWVRAGSDRVNQLYRVTHSGGTTEVSVNHKRVGNGLVYLGTFHFEAGTSGYVDISNRNSQSGVVIADMIRFGNGVGDINLGHGTSGVLREDEPGVYWIIKNLGQGISSSEYGGSDATVSAPPRFAEYMNREQDGSLSDRVFISYHSNAGSGSNRGTLGLVNGNNNPATATPNQFLLANTVSAEINDDMVALNGTFEHDWFNRTTHTLDRSDIEFGEINNNYINNEFDATIIEWLFHDNALDTDLMRDPEVRKAVARATYQGLQKYFNSVDGGATGLTFMPDPVTDVSAKTNGDGTVTVSWAPPAATAIGGGTPTGYMVYTSLNGYGFDGGTYVSGGATTSKVMSGLDSANGTHYFKVVAVNAGGQSLGSDVVAATPLAAPPVSKVLIVNGFDRNDKGTNERYTVPGGTIDRVRLRYQNTRDYAIQVAEAIEAFNPALGIDTVQNESVINLSVSLTDYDTVVWILGEESSGDDTFNNAEQFLVTNYINAGGDLLVSGTEIGWDLDALNNGRSFYNNMLGGDYVADDSNSHTVTGVTGSIFEGLTFSFDNGTQFYDSEFPDVINPTAGAISALSYIGGTGGGAAIQKKGTTSGDIVMLAFPFETITTASDRALVMERVLNFFGTAPSEVPAPPIGLVVTPGNDTVSLDWIDNAEPDLAGYNVYRATVSGGPFTKLNGSLVLSSQFTDSTAENGTTYFYQVTAVDIDTNESVPSVELSATPDDHGNDKNTATLVSTVPSVTAGQMGATDSDWFKLNLTAGNDYTFTVIGAGLSGAEVRFYTSGLTLLASDNGPVSGSTLAQTSYSVGVSDIYFVQVIGKDGAAGDYQFAVQETDDHGNTTGEATDFGGPFVLGSIEVGGDVDFFRVPAVSGMTYTFNVYDAGIPDATLKLYDGGGALIQQANGATPGGIHAKIVWTASANGFIYLSVETAPASLGNYLLSFSLTDQLTGDLNGDGFVGLNDLNIVLTNWNQNVTAGDWLLGDPTGDGFVGIEDLNTVLGNWNAGTPPIVQATTTSLSESTADATASANPEPVAGVVESGTQTKHNDKQRRRTGRQQMQRTPARNDYRQGLAIANWRSAPRSAFGTPADHSIKPVFGLWEKDDAGE